MPILELLLKRVLEFHLSREAPSQQYLSNRLKGSKCICRLAKCSWIYTEDEKNEMTLNWKFLREKINLII